MGTPFIRTSGLCFAVLPFARSLLLGALKSMPHLSAHEAAASRSETKDVHSLICWTYRQCAMLYHQQRSNIGSGWTREDR